MRLALFVFVASAATLAHAKPQVGYGPDLPDWATLGSGKSMDGRHLVGIGIGDAVTSAVAMAFVELGRVYDAKTRAFTKEVKKVTVEPGDEALPGTTDAFQSTLAGGIVVKAFRELTQESKGAVERQNVTDLLELIWKGDADRVYIKRIQRSVSSSNAPVRESSETSLVQEGNGFSAFLDAAEKAGWDLQLHLAPDAAIAAVSFDAERAGTAPPVDSKKQDELRRNAEKLEPKPSKAKPAK